ncbi:MAG: hypothetical protein VW945_06705, partial [Candidatus Poseidoniales archaeon]
ADVKHRYTKTQAMYLSRKGVLPDDVDMFGMGVSLDDDGEHDDLFASGAVEDEPQATEDDGDDLFAGEDADDLFADDGEDDLFADDGSDDLFADDDVDEGVVAEQEQVAAEDVPEAPSEPVEEYVEEEPAGDDEDDDDDIDALFA